MPVRRTALASACAGLAVAGLLLGAGTPASAASAAPSTSPAQHQAEAVCSRAPKVDARITRALARLHGPGSERGSIARLQKRVGLAEGAGQTAVETYLNDRLTTRRAMVGTLTTRQTDLKGVENWCTANHLGAS